MIYFKISLPFKQYTNNHTTLKFTKAKTVENLISQACARYPLLKPHLTDKSLLYLNNKLLKKTNTLLANNDVLFLKAKEKQSVDVILQVKKYSHIDHKHYYHFFLGCLYPFIFWSSKHKSDNSIRYVYLRSCSYLDKIFKEISFKNLKILDRNTFDSIVTDKNLNKKYTVCTIKGWDFTRDKNILDEKKLVFPKKAIGYVNNFLFKKLSKQIAKCAAELPKE
jgi:hypothetical protein